jgi:antitoxin PrlF
MPTSTITKEGQIILPTEVREHLHLVAGDRVEFLINAGGTVELRPISGSFREAFGMLHQPGMRPVSVEEMNEGIAQFHAAENERILKGDLPKP